MIRLHLAGVAGLIFLAACAGTGDEVTNPEGTAEVRLMNAASGAPVLDLVVGGQVVASGVAFARSSAIRTVPGGTQTVTLRRSGETALLASRQIAFTAGARYNVVATGSGNLLLLTPSMVVDTGLAKPDRANIRIINIGSVSLPADSGSLPAAIPLDVVIVPAGVSPPGAGNPLSIDARFSSYSTLMYFDPGSYVVRFRRTGTGELVAETPAIAIAAGQVRAVTLLRGADGTYHTIVVSEE